MQAIDTAAEPIRVVHLVLSLNVGGLEKVVLDLARCRDKARFAVRVLCLQERGSLAPQFEAIGVPVDSLDCPSLAKARTLFRLIRRLRALRPHVLHTHNASPHFFGAVAARLAGIPVVIHTKHGRNHPDRFRAVLANRVASFLSRRIVAVSDATAAVARDVERIPESKLGVIRNGIDLERFRPKPEPGADAGFRIVHVARLQRIKDQTTLLRAARLVADAEPRFRLDLVGDGPDRAKLEALVAELRLGSHVRFLGHQNDVAPMLADGNIFVLSSLSEGIPLTLLEAMATGLPAVVTDVGGNREVVIPGETGLLVPPQSAEKLANALLSLLRDRDLARHMGTASRQRIGKHFDVRRVTEQYESLYVDLLHEWQTTAK